MEWAWELVEVISVSSANFAAWFIGELRDFDLVKMLEALAALLAIGFTIWRIWLRVIANPAKRLIKYLRERDGRLLNKSSELVADVSKYGARKLKPMDARRKFMDVDKTVGRAVSDFQFGNSKRAKRRLEELAVDISEKKGLATEVSTVCDKEASLIHLLRGIMAYYEKDYQSATTALKLSIELNSDQLDALKHLGLIEFDTGHLADAERYFEQLVAAATNNTSWKAEANRLLGFVRLHSGTTGRAKDVVEQAAQLENDLGDPLNIARTHELLGDVQHTLGFWDMADTSYQRSERKYREASRANEASRVAEKITALEPANRSPQGQWNDWIELADLILLHFRVRELATT